MRLRTFELPLDSYADGAVPPFILVLDQVDPDERGDYIDAKELLVESTGAKAALIFQGEVELG